MTDFTTTALCAGVKRRGFLSGGSGLSNSELLLYASDELRNFIPAFLKSIREEFLITTLDIPVTSGTVTVPARAVGAALRTIGMLQSDGRVVPLARIEPENAGGFSGQTGVPCGYVFRGNQVQLLPAPTSGTLRLTYQQRPGQLVLPSATLVIATVIDLTGITPTPSWGLVFASAHGIAGPITTPRDIISAVPNFPLVAMDAELEVDSTTTLIITKAECSQDPAAGDYVALAGETPIPQIPTEVHDLLAQATAAAIADAQGSQRLEAINKKLEKLKEETRMVLSPRSDGSARVVVSRSRLGRFGWGW